MSFRVPTSLLIFMLLFSGCAKINKARVAESKKRGNRIVAAIEQFAAVHNAYPKTLEALTPNYLPRIENPTYGNKWEYEILDDGEHFWLSFERSPTSPVYYYTSLHNRWSVDTR